MKPLAFLVAWGLRAIIAAGAAAQTREEVRFAPGNFGTMLTGRITGQEYRDYTLGAGAGQSLFAEIAVTETGGNGSVYFNILPPGSTGEAIYVGASDTDRAATVALPEDGTYTIRVYLLGNDQDTGKTVGYTLDVSIQ